MSRWGCWETNRYNSGVRPAPLRHIHSGCLRLGGALLGLLLASCTPSPAPRVEVPDLELAVASIALNDGFPTLFPAVVAIGPDGTSSAPVTIPPGLTVEFTPVAFAADNPAPFDITLSVVIADEEREVGHYTTTKLTRGEHPAASIQALLAHPVTANLDEFAGQTAVLRWTADNAATHSGYLAGLRLTTRGPVPPDILLVCSDTHRLDHATVGKGPALMPRLAGFASQATVYPRARSTASWTLPAITSVATGLYPASHDTGRRAAWQVPPPPGFIPFPSIGDDHLLTAYPRDFRTIAEDLQRLGYRTVTVAANGYYGAAGLGFDGNDLFVDANAMIGEPVNQLAEAALAATPATTPLLLQVHYVDVHEWEREIYPRMPASLPRKERIDRSYAQMVRQSDELLGKLLDAWSAARGPNSSLIAFWADHGEHLLDPELGHGRTLKPELIDVPLVIRYPASVKAPAAWLDRNVSLVDLAPTLLDFAESPADRGRFEGHSLLQEPPASRIVFAEYQQLGDPSSTALEGPVKVLLNEETQRFTVFVDGVEVPEPAIADTATRERAARLRETLNRRQAGFSSVGPRDGSRRAADPDRAVESLRNLGYIQ